MRNTREAIFLMTAVVACACAGRAHAQDPAAGYKWPEHPWHTHVLTPNIAWIEGGGGNSGVLVGPHEVIVYDAKTTADTGKKLLEEISKITPKPISTVILSHSDVDHVGGLRAFPQNIVIIAQAHDLKELQVDLANDPTHALPAQYFPNKTMQMKENLSIDGFKMQLLHWAPAHTGGDLVLYLPAQKILFTGDVITANRDHPLIHLNKDGSSEGWITTVKGLLTLDVERYVTGHGDVMGRPAIEKMLHDAESERAQIKAMVAQGKSLQEIEKATGDPSAEEKAGPPFASFAEVVYQELSHAPNGAPAAGR